MYDDTEIQGLIDRGVAESVEEAEALLKDQETIRGMDFDAPAEDDEPSSEDLEESEEEPAAEAPASLDLDLNEEYPSMAGLKSQKDTPAPVPENPKAEGVPLDDIYPAMTQDMKKKAEGIQGDTLDDEYPSMASLPDHRE